MTTTATQPPTPQECEKHFSSSPDGLPRASQNTWANAIIFTMLAIAIGLWTVRRVFTGQSAVAGEELPFFWIFSGMFALLALQLTLAMMERSRFREINDGFVTAVIIPLYNEDPALAWRAIKSILYQERRPDYLVVINDGSNSSFDHDYWIMNWAAHYLATSRGVKLAWDKTPNRGKRHAQAEAMKVLPAEVTHVVTVDSDSALDRMALRKGMMPFGTNAKIQSVAGVVLSMNALKNPLTAVMDLLFVSQQLTDRSAMSRLGSVMVNSGALAIYRAEILRDNMDAYLNETFMGVPVHFSDDSMLTLYALKKGKAVQHPGVFSFSMMPENFAHHRKQQLRWMRGSFIRSIWRIRYLSLLSFGFVRQLLGWAQGLTTLILSFTLLVFYPIFEQKFVWEYALAPIILGYVLSLRYFSVRRSDISGWRQFSVFLLGPIMWLYQVTVLRAFRFWGALTCRKTGWATRQNGAEVTLNKAA